VASIQVAIAATVCTGLYPVFFAQSSMAQVDLAAAGFTFWALSSYLEQRLFAAILWFSFAVLAKETAIFTPIALIALELLGFVINPTSRLRGLWHSESGKPRMIFAMLVPAVVLAGWYAFHYSQTGYVFGNPEFFRYNVASTLNPLRFLLALLLRLWQTFGYMHLWLLTIGMLLVMLLPPLKDGAVARRRIAIPVQVVFFAIIAAYVLAMALIGGAVLARYMLTAVPLVMILAVSTLYMRLRFWVATIALVGAAFVSAWFWNPPYGFSPEDNLAYRDYVLLHENGERFLEARYPMAHVLTAWPASDELTRPWLGYVTRPVQVVRIEDFSLEQVISAAELRDHFEVALVFSTKYEPRHTLLERWNLWTEWKRRFFGFHRDLPPAAAAHILGGKIVFSEQRAGQWVAVIEMDRSEWINAKIAEEFPSARLLH
jgi:hypothetical protein